MAADLGHNIEPMQVLRRNDYDVTNTVQVSSTAAVTAAVGELFRTTWPGAPFDRVARAFGDFDLLFTGRMPGYHGVDTVYHDRQHTLDMTLAAARLLVGYERTAAPALRLGVDRTQLALVVALFHDAGYIRESGDRQHLNGAEFTPYHVTRSAHFIARYLPLIGMESWAPVATRIVHFTGYEVPIDQIQLDDRRDRKLGQLLGTADLIAQMADRCYLEKCRDRLYPEFVLGGIAATAEGGGAPRVRYSSGLDLLRQTPRFVHETRIERLERGFEHAYRHVEALFGGANPYLEAIERNLAYLDHVLRTARWQMLRRNPPLFTAGDNQMPQVRGLMLDRLKALWA
ncbi:MAG TPA: hypothetical protein VND80_03130 [Steroidobacteraceae bacterium]|nr:hypothetical protein [Steroidobacteraceae bacterium]